MTQAGLEPRLGSTGGFWTWLGDGLMDNQESSDLVSQLVDSVKKISGLPECRNASRQMYDNLVRRVKLLSPLFEELKDSEEELGSEDVRGLQLLKMALNSAMELLRSTRAARFFRKILY